MTCIITVEINGIERLVGETSPSEIAELLNRTIAGTGTASLKVSIRHPDANLGLYAGAFPPGRSGWRPNELEQRIFDRWMDSGFRVGDKPDPGQLAQFLRWLISTL